LPNSSLQRSVSDVIPVIFISDVEKIKVLMEQQFHTQSNLTIGVLAESLGMPEHRLRLLINMLLHLTQVDFKGV
jgi:hypothetical protein